MAGLMTPMSAAVRVNTVVMPQRNLSRARFFVMLTLRNVWVRDAARIGGRKTGVNQKEFLLRRRMFASRIAPYPSIKGHLDGRWADWFGGMTIALEDNGDTIITGPMVDQAALHGMLNKIRDLSMPLLSVNRLGDDNTLIQGKEKPMTTYRKTAIIVGALYIMGTVSGILSRVFTGPIGNAQDSLISVSANGNPIILGALFLLTMGLALAMVPVMMFPILKKHNEVLALGYVVFRGGLETVTYMAMVVSWLLLLPLSQVYRVGTPDASNLYALSTILLDGNEIGSILAIVFCLGALMFNYLLYQAKLIPRWISGWGLIAVIPYLAGGVLAMVDLIKPVSTIATVLDIPLGVQEMVLAVWLIAKGFNPIAIASGSAKVDMN